MDEDRGINPLKDTIGESAKDCPQDCTAGDCNVCQELADLDKEIQTMENLLRKRKQQRITLKALRNNSHSPLTKKLPYETIFHIFSLVHQSIDYFSLGNQRIFPLGYFCAPVLLASVCHRWREIALSLPELWTNVYINFYREVDQLTEEWLNRSRPLPLNLTLYKKEDSKSSRPSEIPLFKLLRLDSARWCFLNLEHGPALGLFRLFEKLEPVPESDSLHIRLGLAGDQHSVGRPASLQPRQFYSIDPKWMDSSVWGWNNLTSLTLFYHLTVRVLEVIEKAPRLKHCVLYNMSPPYAHKNVNTVVNKSLEDLTLSFDTYDTFFLQILALPSLQHLKYDMPGNIDNNPGPFHDLWNFLIRSEIRPTSLKTFNLGYHAASWPNSDRAEFEEIVGALTHLSIEIKHGSNTLDSFLLWGSNVGTHLEKLQLQVALSNYTNPSMGIGTWDALCDFISECNFNARLELEDPPEYSRRSLNSISIVFARNLSSKVAYIKIRKDTLLRLRQAQKAGPLTLTISTESSEKDVLQGTLSWLDLDNGVVLWEIRN